MDRNTENAVLFLMTAGSLSARRAWIEIRDLRNTRMAVSVALRKESVDRNAETISGGFFVIVALRKESVDRNREVSLKQSAAAVALRKESVDRNSVTVSLYLSCALSLSARRAWIEMQVPVFGGYLHGSLSARRAWIEICWGAAVIAALSGRSPQGERG